MNSYFQFALKGSTLYHKQKFEETGKSRLIIPMRALFHWIHKIFFISEEKTPSGRYLRWVSHALILSVSLNIALLVTFIYRGMTEGNAYLALREFTYNEPSYQEEFSGSKGEILNNLQQLSYQELVTFLRKKTPVEDGLLMRDFALAVLCKRDDFDLKRALGRENIPSFKLILAHEGEVNSWRFYGELSEEEREELSHFAYKEAYPFTTSGLLKRMRQRIASKQDVEKDLLKTFLISQEYLALEPFLKRREASIGKKEIVALILSASDDLFFDVVGDKPGFAEAKVEKRLAILERYLKEGSRPAALLLLREDPRMLVKKAPQSLLVELLAQVSPDDKRAEQLCLEALTSARGPKVWELASAKLYAKRGMELKEPFVHVQALRDLVPPALIRDKLEIAMGEEPIRHITPIAQEELHSEPKPETKTPKEIYIVAPGDSLWKIAHKLGTDVKVLRELNQVEGDYLRVGQELSIP